MAKKKQKQVKIKLTKPMLIFIIIVLLVVASVFGFMYFKTSKELDKIKISSSEVIVDGNNSTLNIELESSNESNTFDIYYESSIGQQVYVVKDCKDFNKALTYTTSLNFNTEYTLIIVLNGSIFNVVGVSKDTNIKTIKTDKKPGVSADSVVYDDFQIHFMELGNEYAGDSTYIKAGEYDILIDAGSRKSSATTIKEYVDNYCTDGKLEYVIATHAHQDHIAGFVGTSSKGSKTGIYYQYQIGTIIDFAKSDSTTTLYKDYNKAVSYAVENGAVNHKADYYFSNQIPTSEAHIEFAPGISMDILYNYYYFNKSNDENNYSVCTMFNYNDKHFLLTGDLELEGEEKMAEYYDGSTEAKTLHHCDLFKAGHHGSKTSSNECLLEKITPDICCVCCCAGSSEYTNNLEHQFPTQAFINRIAKYTEDVYVTSMLTYNGSIWTNTSMNGNIIVSSDGTNIGLAASNNLIKLKDTEWFNEKVYAVKTTATYTWNKAGDKFDVYQNCPKTGSTAFYTSSKSGAVLIPRRVWPTYSV